MSYITTFWHDLKLCIGVGISQWRYIRRHLRRGGSPDVEF